ncbi:MAG TPA: thioredoxin [Clostridiaceae bacterium]|jgi:thioredoxin 1|nr:thioredoxin [Clostridiaceae bacterium]
MAIKNVSKHEFDTEISNSKLPVLVDFWAPWCGPCRMLSPVLDELAGEMNGKVKILKVNVDEEPELASKYGVMSIPTVIAFKQGKATNKVVGFRSKEEFKNMIL